MQSQQQQDALLPRPRGALPRVCAALLVAGATGGFRFLSPEELLGWVALVTLTLTLGPLLHGLCLLPEEVLHHRHTRYRGRGLLSHVVPACGLCGGTLAAAGLAALLLYLAGDPLAKHGDTWRLLVLTSVFYALLKSLVVLVPSEVEVSDLCEARKTHVAHGLAWSFYLGYLKLVLPHLDESIEWFRSTHLTNGACWSHRSRRLFILVPLDASISHKLQDEDDNIRFYGNLPNCEMDRAGVRGRVYKHSVYTVLDQNGKGHECVVEYATPLLTLYRMSQESSSGFGEAERRQQVLLFYRTLQDILELSLECRNRYTLILLDDDRTDDPHFLSNAILRHLQQQEKEEFCLGPPAHQQTVCPARCAVGRPPGAPAFRGNWRNNPEPMSREPTLMISLEKPQPLKEPVENTDDY